MPMDGIPVGRYIVGSAGCNSAPHVITRDLGRGEEREDACVICNASGSPYLRSCGDQTSEPPSAASDQPYEIVAVGHECVGRLDFPGADHRYVCGV